MPSTENYAWCKPSFPAVLSYGGVSLRQVAAAPQRNQPRRPCAPALTSSNARIWRNAGQSTAQLCGECMIRSLRLTELPEVVVVRLIRAA